MNNSEYFNVLSVLLYYVILFLLPLIALIIIYYYANCLNRKLAIITIISLLLTTYLTPIATNIFRSTAETNIFIHIGTFVVVYSIILGYSFGKKLTTIVFVSIIIITISTQQLSKAKFTLLQHAPNNTDFSDRVNNTSLYGYLFDTEMKYKPDIFLLVYDSFVSSEQMKYYNINNYELSEFLENSGFVVYNNTYSNSSDSQQSISGVLNIWQNTERPGKINANKIICGNSTVDNILQNNGYHTNYILGDYLLRGNHNFGGDYVFPKKSITTSAIADLKNLIQCILLGEFIWNLEFQYADDYAWEQAQTARIKLQLDNPKFLYSHDYVPGHSQNSGKLLQRDLDNYIENVIIANNKIKDDVKEILSGEKESIIIIAGDHGPYLTGDGFQLSGYKEKEISGLNIIDRYGVFLAVKYPDAINQPYKNDIMLLQNIFVHIFSILFEDDEILKYKAQPTTFKPKLRKKTPMRDGAIKNGLIMYGLATF